MGFRNRCSIAGASGILQLSIPLAGGRDQKTLMRDVRVKERRAWQREHWRTIVSCYSRSPWFDHYRDDLETLFGKPVQFLLDWNLACFEWSLQALGLTRAIGLTEGYEASYDTGTMMDWRGKIVPKNRATLGEEGHSPYHQVFEDRIGFIPNLSILDLLFCEGKEAIRYIRS